MAADADREPAAKAAAPSARPAVSIVLPFAGSAAEAEEAVAQVLAVERGPDDEVIVVDNSGTGAVAPRNGISVVRADDEPSSYYARNVGGDAARNEWLLLIDADCRPAPDLLARYFDEPIADDVGAVIGEVAGVPGQDELVARYARSRGHLGQLHHWTSEFRPWGITANLLVRREAWASIGGFHEGIRSSGDTEFSWRLQDAGWSMAYRPAAVVEHHHRESVRQLARQAARYGAGRSWLVRRYPDSIARPRLLREMARSAAGIVVWTVTGRFERATFKALDAVYVVSNWSANVLSNTPPGPAAPRDLSPVAAIASAFPALDAPEAVARVRAMGDVPVEAVARPIRVDRVAARSLPIAWAEDDGPLRRWSAVLWLMTRHPLRCARHALVAGNGARTPLGALAPRARRLAGLGVRELRPVGADAEPDASALARLLGIESR